MFEKVNPSHPDKIADRIAGAIIDLAYRDFHNPRIAVEILIGHGYCHAIIETNVFIDTNEIKAIIKRIGGDVTPDIKIYAQDTHLQENQAQGFKMGDNGIFKGVPLTDEEKELSKIARDIYKRFPFDGKYILDKDRLVICQSNTWKDDLLKLYPKADINPLGYWTGGTYVDTGCTNRKLGSDMAQSITGGGLHGKDLSKADVSVNIYAFVKAQATGEIVELSCAIGDDFIDGKHYSAIVEFAREYINDLGGFEKFAEWGLF